VTFPAVYFFFAWELISTHWSHGHDEAHFRRNKPQTQTGIRIPRSDADQKWTKSDSGTPPERTVALVGFVFLIALLPQENRLKHRRDFDAVYQRGFRRGSHCFTLRVLRCPEQPTRIGISISKKVSKRAVVRNRIKRQVRSILRSFLPRTKSGFSIVIGVRIEATECDYPQYLQELEQLLVKAEVLNGS